MNYTLEPGQEVDAAISVIMNEAPQILPFTTDERARPPMKAWLAENGMHGDVGRLNNQALCTNVLMRWFAIHSGGGYMQHVQQFGHERWGFTATIGSTSATSRESYLVALARLLLLVAEPAYRVAVQALMDEEQDDGRDESDDEG